MLHFITSVSLFPVTSGCAVVAKKNRKIRVVVWSINMFPTQVIEYATDVLLLSYHSVLLSLFLTKDGACP